MDWIVQTLWLIPALPLLAAALSALLKQPQRRLAALLAIGSMIFALEKSRARKSRALFKLRPLRISALPRWTRTARCGRIFPR